MIEDTLEDDFAELEAQENDALRVAEVLGYTLRGVTPLRDERREILNFYDSAGVYEP